MQPITDIAAAAGLLPEELELYGPHKAKVSLSALQRLADRPDGKLVLVTAITPTPAGEGKTTTSIGLAQALSLLGKRAVVALREPSLGPVFGVKGGATGGGKSQVHPASDINLHFTGDIHAVTSAHNLLCAMLDNSLYFKNPLGLNPRRITFPRVMDMNDRSLRNVVLGLGGEGFARESGFHISAASEVMAVLGLSESLEDLKAGLCRIVVGESGEGQPVTAEQLGAAGAMTAVLKDALKPNLVQTSEGTPALIHTGPFANIAHGNSSILGTRLALKLGDYVVTEGGFGADLGAEKFFGIAARKGGFSPAAVVLVATLRALKYHGGAGKEEWGKPDRARMEAGLPNLFRHVDNLRKTGAPVVVAVNQFPTDPRDEIDRLVEMCRDAGVTAAGSEIFTGGGEGGAALAEAVVAAAGQKSSVTPLYELSLPLEEKIETVCRQIYGAGEVLFTKRAVSRLKRFTDWGYGQLPVCLAKTQYSFSDDPKLRGAPEGFEVTVRDATLSAGAGFVVAVLGKMMLMPGLPRRPSALDIDVAGDEVVGIG